MRLRHLFLPPIVLGIVWLAAIWWPTSRMLDTEQQALETQQQQQLALVSEIDRLNGFDESLPAIERDMEAIAAAVPGDPAVDTFIATIASEAAIEGISIRLVSPTEILEAGSSDGVRPLPPGITAVVVSITADGEFGAVMRFLRRLDELERLVVVDTLSMNALSTTDDATGGSVTIDLGLRIFTTASGTTASLETASLETASLETASLESGDERVDLGLLTEPAEVDAEGGRDREEPS